MAAKHQELLSNLAQHKAQLQQVEAALTNDPENEELMKLKTDLEDVISITGDLIDMSGPPQENVKPWNQGDICLALWDGDDEFHMAKVESVSEDSGKCSVTYLDYDLSQEIPIADLKPLNKKEKTEPSTESRKRPVLGGAEALSAKYKKAELRELKKKKQQKKLQKWQESEQMREKGKQKWQTFVHKTGKKGTPLGAKPKKSIFSVPDSIHGKVGVGTCNIGGKGMTEYVTPKGYTKSDEVTQKMP